MVVLGRHVSHHQLRVLLTTHTNTATCTTHQPSHPSKDAALWEGGDIPALHTPNQEKLCHAAHSELLRHAKLESQAEFIHLM